MSSMKLFQMAMLVLAVAALSGSSAFAQSSIPNPNAWVTNASVYAIVHSGDTTYIGGQFTYVGPNTGCAVPLSAATGQPVSTYPKVNGLVRTSVSDGSGGWYIGGDFTQVGTTSRSTIAHILSDGTVDAAWNPNASSAYFTSIKALAVSDDGATVYVGGRFTTIGSQPRNYIAALDATTGLATAWNPNADSEIFALALSGTTVYVGGRFTTIGGQPRNYIAALDATTGLATGWNPDSEGRYGPAVYALAVSETTVYAGGAFWRIGGQPRNYIAALDATTGLATGWNPDANGQVNALAVSGLTVYAGGAFGTIGGQTRNSIAALDTTTGLATTWDPNPFDASISAIAILGTTVYVGGHFTSIGGQTRNHIAALDAVTGLATAWNPYPNDPVSTLAVSGTTVYAGGQFTSIGGKTRNCIAALDASGVLTSWDPNASGAPICDINALAVSKDGTAVYASGAFLTIGGQPRHNLAVLDATTGLATAWDPNPSSSRPYSCISALAVSGTTVYVGGNFTSIAGQPRSYIAALDTSGLATTWNPDPNDMVGVLAVSDDGTTVYAGGKFTTIGGQPRHYLAALDPATGNATAWNPDTNYPVLAMAVSGSTVYAVGVFDTIGGQTRNGIAALDTATGLATSWDPNAGTPNPAVFALTISGATVYAGGAFTNIGSQTRRNVAALEAGTGLSTPWDPSPNGAVGALAVSETKVYAGGNFTTIGGNSQPYYAEFDIPPSGPTASITLDDPNPTGLDVLHFSVDFSEPLLTPLTATNVSLTPGSLPGSIEVSNADPDYTVTVTLSEPDVDGVVGITIPAGVVSDLEGDPYEGDVSQFYLIWNGALPVAGLAGMAILLGLLTITGAKKMRKK